MKLADKLLKRSEVEEASVNDAGQLEKKAMAVIERLKEEKFYESNEDQGNMVKLLSKLAESDSKESNKFMKHMDEAASVYGMSDSQQREKEIKAKAAKDAKTPTKKL